MENKEIIKKLNSKDQNVVINTLNYVSTDGNQEILKHVLILLKSTKDELIRNEIAKILENLKNQDCAQVLVDSIKNADYKNELPMLVSACWKNGLNFENNLDTFVEVFIHTDFITAFDAFTVIDNFEQIKVEDADKSIIKLNTALEDIKEDKKQLVYELIKIINHLKENPAN